jgi:hypothetical protein
LIPSSPAATSSSSPTCRRVLKKEAVIQVHRHHSKLQIAEGETTLPVMRRSLHPHSRVFRSLLVLALLAWTALAFNAFAQPLSMADVGNTPAAMMGGASGTHCDGMPMRHASPGAHPAPSHPAGNGHGCCANGHCYCASLCNGIVDVPYLDMTWIPLHAPVLVPVHVAPAQVQTAPPLRPPIA